MSTWAAPRDHRAMAAAWSEFVPFADYDVEKGTIGNEVEASAQCVRDHLRRPDHPDRN